jgi:hypothetical protein
MLPFRKNWKRIPSNQALAPQSSPLTDAVVLDDLSAALGNFVFKVAVAGELARTSAGRTQIIVRHFGLFIRDSFDFNGTQFLGYLDDTDNSVSTKNPLSGTAVWNSDFRTWRTRNRRGGDFLVFSDVKRLTLSKPDVLSL